MLKGVAVHNLRRVRKTIDCLMLTSNYKFINFFVALIKYEKNIFSFPHSQPSKHFSLQIDINVVSINLVFIITYQSSKNCLVQMHSLDANRYMFV